MTRCLGFVALFIAAVGTAVAQQSGEAYPLCTKYDYTSDLRLASMEQAGHRGPVTCLSFAPDSKSLAWGGPDHDALHIAQLPSGKEVHSFKLRTMGIRSIARSDDGRYVAASAGWDSMVQLWDVSSGAAIQDFSDEKHSALCLGFAADGKQVHGGGRDGVLRSWECKSGKEIQFASVASTAFPQMLISADASRLAVFDRKSKEICVRHLPDMEVLSRFGTDRLANLLAASSADGRLVATSHLDGSVHLWEAGSGKEIATWPGSGHPVRAVAIAPDGKTVATGSNDTVIRLYEVYTQQQRATLRGDKLGIVSLAFSPDGCLLASGSDDGACVAWDLTGRQAARLPPAAKLTEYEIATLWDTIKSAEAGPAWRDCWSLVSGGDATVAYLREHLKNSLPEQADPEKVQRLIAKLDSDDFVEREAASAALARMGPNVAAALVQALKDKPSLEVSRRIHELLDKLVPRMEAEGRRHWRAIEILEQIGSEEARRLVEELAAGTGDEVLKREAKASLDRWARRR